MPLLPFTPLLLRFHYAFDYAISPAIAAADIFAYSRRRATLSPYGHYFSLRCHFTLSKPLSLLRHLPPVLIIAYYFQISCLPPLSADFAGFAVYFFLHCFTLSPFSISHDVAAATLLFIFTLLSLSMPY